MFSFSSYFEEYEYEFDLVLHMLNFFPFLGKTETLKLLLWIFMSEGFYICVILLYKLVTGIDLDLSALSTV